MKTKKIIALLVVFALALSLAGCRGAVQGIMADQVESVQAETEEGTEPRKDLDETKQEDTGWNEDGKGGTWLEDTALEEDYILPDSDKRYIGREELWDLDKATLRLARNEIYARHGLIFEEEDLREYFNSKPWYYGCVSAEEFDEDLYLSEYEKDTVYMIYLMEEDIGPFYGTIDLEQELSWIGVYFSEDGQVISVLDMSDDGVEISFSGYTEEGDYTYTTWFPYTRDDRTQVVDNAEYPLGQTVFTLTDEGIQVDVLPDGGWAAGFYVRQ